MDKLNFTSSLGEKEYMRMAMEVPKKVAIALTRLASGSTLEFIDELYGVGTSTVQQCVLDFSRAIKLKVRELMCGMHWPSETQYKEYAVAFEAKHGIPNVIGAIDGSHIPSTAPSEHGPDYYNRKGFHSILLQIIVDNRCLIWDYDVGWAGSMHDWAHFQQTAAYMKFEFGEMRNYCLLGDAGCTPRPYLLTPFINKGSGFNATEKHWNFIQSSTRMPVERAFGILKARFRILLKKTETHLQHVPQVVVACLVMHNLCIIHNESFDQSWVSEAAVELEEVGNGEEDNEASETSQNEAREALRELDVLREHRNENQDMANGAERDNGNEGHVEAQVVEEQIVLQSTARRDALARALYDARNFLGMDET